MQSSDTYFKKLPVTLRRGMLFTLIFVSKFSGASLICQSLKIEKILLKLEKSFFSICG